MGCCWLFALLGGWLVVLCRFDVFVDLFVFSYYMIVGLGVCVCFVVCGLIGGLGLLLVCGFGYVLMLVVV